MRLANTLPLAALVLCLAGCSRPRIDGQWDGTKALGPATQNVTYFFRKDGTYTEVNELRSAVGALKTTWTGTYEVRDNTVILTKKHGDLNGVAFNRFSPAVETKTFEIKDDTLILGLNEAQKVVLKRKNT